MEGLRLWQLLLALASGYAVFAVISKYLFHVCPACAASHFDEATTHRFSEIASAMMLALAIHCTVDGLAMTAGSETSANSAAAVILAVCVHKIPEGLALGALLRGAGLPTGKILLYVIGVEATTLLGGALGWVFFPTVPKIWILRRIGPCRRGIYLSGHPRHHRRDSQAPQGAGLDVLRGGSQSDWGLCPGLALGALTADASRRRRNGNKSVKRLSENFTLTARRCRGMSYTFAIC